VRAYWRISAEDWGLVYYSLKSLDESLDIPSVMRPVAACLSTTGAAMVTAAADKARSESENFMMNNEWKSCCNKDN
jgi:hypothetical protein